MNDNLYCYRAKVISVYDGDTCTVDIDLGLGVWVKGEKLRLSRINAPEIRGGERGTGLKARDFLREQIEGKQITLKTIKDRKGKYGRYLGEIFIEDADKNMININDLLVGNGYALYKEY